MHQDTSRPFSICHCHSGPRPLTQLAEYLFSLQWFGPIMCFFTFSPPSELIPSSPSLQAAVRCPCPPYYTMSWIPRLLFREILFPTSLKPPLICSLLFGLADSQQVIFWYQLSDWNSARFFVWLFLGGIFIFKGSGVLMKRNRPCLAEVKRDCGN